MGDPNNEEVSENATSQARSDSPEKNELSNSQVGESVQCKACGKAPAEDGYAAPLCANCRTILAKRPVPVLITGVAAAVLAMVGVAMFFFPRTLTAGIALERAQRYEGQHHYYSAVREYSRASEIYPGSQYATAHLFASYYRSGQYDKADEVFKKIAGQEARTPEIAKLVNSDDEEMNSFYYPSNEFEQLLQSETQSPPEQRLAGIQNYIKAHPKENLPYRLEAELYYDQKRYDIVIEKVEAYLRTNPNDAGAEQLLVGAYREAGQYDKAVQLTNSLVQQEFDRSSVDAMLARIDLKRHQDSSGLEWAKKAIALESDNPYVKSTLALAFHYNHQYKDRDQTIALLDSKNDRDKADLGFIQSVVSGQLVWRNE